MSSCERCWADSAGNTDRYRELILIRNCTAEEQAGPHGASCPICGRMTIHQHTGEPMCGHGVKVSHHYESAKEVRRD